RTPHRAVMQTPSLVSSLRLALCQDLAPPPIGWHPPSSSPATITASPEKCAAQPLLPTPRTGVSRICSHRRTLSTPREPATPPGSTSDAPSLRRPASARSPFSPPPRQVSAPRCAPSEQLAPCSYRQPGW